MVITVRQTKKDMDGTADFHSAKKATAGTAVRRVKLKMDGIPTLTEVLSVSHVWRRMLLQSRLPCCYIPP